MARTVNIAEHAARRDAILDAVQGLIMSKGYEDLTVQDVLAQVHISKGAFYHYFDGKAAVIEALTDRLVSESVRVLAPIVDDAAAALDKLPRFFDEIVRWKSVQQDLFVAMLPVWYASGNLTFRRKLDLEVAKQLAPMLTVIIHQGVAEGRFATTYPEQAGMVVVGIVQALQDAMAQALLGIPDREPTAPVVADLVAIHSAHLEAIERFLGIPAQALGRVEAPMVRCWIAALRANTR